MKNFALLRISFLQNMDILVNQVGKRYNREWIFRHLSATFSAGKYYAITGPNGSGKSTLLQVISGAVTYTEGKIDYSIAGKLMEETSVFEHIAIAAPYLELIEEMTAKEMLDFHSKFKKLVLPIDEILSIVGLSKATNKQIRYFSSGMKQRLKLAQAFLSDTPVLFLDEPTTNLDQEGCALYHQLVNNFTKGKLVIVSSNDPQEYNFCSEVIDIAQYK